MSRILERKVLHFLHEHSYQQFVRPFHQSHIRKPVKPVKPVKPANNF